MEPLTELFLFEAARAELVKTVIRPALQREDLVLCDRYIDSTVAYQGYGRGLNRNSLHMVNRIATEWLLPDLTILLDLDPAIGLARRQQSGEVNRFDDERVEFAKRIRDGFLQLVKQNPGRFVVLNAERDPETLQQMAYLEIKRRLPR
jgi:dTMP kinase